MRYNIPMERTEGMTLRYSRNILIEESGPEGQERIFGSSVLVVGAGGRGSPALLYLAAAGGGRIGVADRDRIEISNLNRQVIHAEKAVGRRKVESAGDAVRAIRSDVVLEEHGTALTAENAVPLFRKYDVVIDGSDTSPTKSLCSAAPVLTGAPLVRTEASLHRY